MRLLLVQNASGPYVPLLQLTHERHRDLCEKQGITYSAVWGRVTERHPNWDRWPLLIQPFDGVIWLDADAIIMDGTQLGTIFDGVPNLGMVKHHTTSWREQGWHWNSGVMALRMTPETIRILKLAWQLGETPAEQPAGWVNQGPLHRALEILHVEPSELDKRWNWTPVANECADPWIKCWHGLGAVEALRDMRCLIGS